MVSDVAVNLPTCLGKEALRLGGELHRGMDEETLRWSPLHMRRLSHSDGRLQEEGGTSILDCKKFEPRTWSVSRPPPPQALEN